MSGLIGGPIILFYIFVAYIIYKAVLSATQKKVLSRVIFALILTFPFWDLIAQKGIKTYYQVFLMEPKVYAMPEFDENGMIESLDLNYRLKNRFTNIKLNKLDHDIQYVYRTILKEKIKYLDFIFLIKGKSQIFRFYLEDEKVKHIILDKPQARYKIIRTKPNFYFGLYKTYTYKLIDTSNNKVLAESFAFYRVLTDFYKDFRKVLPPSAKVVYSVDGFQDMMEKVFGVKRFY